MSSNSLAPQYIKYEIRRGVEPSHMEKYTFIDRYFHSQRELLDIRHSEEIKYLIKRITECTCLIFVQR